MTKERSRFTLIERRNALAMLGAGASLALPGWALGKSGLWKPDDLPLTPQQIEGPFYPEKSIEQQLYNDTDLRKKLDDQAMAKGQPVVIHGVIKNQQGKPLTGSVVEIWQACSSGRYNHSGDNRNPGLLDNNFQFWGRAITGEDGKYSFKTIVPGKYPGRTARHIHFRVDSNGFRRCTTQSYFSDFGGDNMKDGIYSSLNRHDRELVTVEFDKPTAAQSGGDNLEQGTDRRASQKKSSILKPSVNGSESWKGQFDVVLANK